MVLLQSRPLCIGLSGTPTEPVSLTAEQMAPSTLALHTLGESASYFLTPVFMIYDNENVCICVQYVLIVCLNVLSTLFSYFSLTRKKKSERHDHFT